MWANPAIAAIDPVVATVAWEHISAAEKKYNIPRGLLHSISLVESGRGVSGHVMPWPYTVGVNSPAARTFTSTSGANSQLNKWQAMGFTRFDVTVGGKSYAKVNLTKARELAAIGTPVKVDAYHFSKRFNSAAEATTFAQRILDLGYTNMDIGLMQINWSYHGKYFPNIAAGFDAERNLNYAVYYLLQHRQNMGWWESVGRYHSGTDKYAKRYIANVYAMYKRVHRLAPNA